MTPFFIRSIALALLPCLVAEPGLAAGFQSGFLSLAPGLSYVTREQAVFATKALVQRALEAHRPLDVIHACGLNRLVSAERNPQAIPGQFFNKTGHERFVAQMEARARRWAYALGAPGALLIYSFYEYASGLHPFRSFISFCVASVLAMRFGTWALSYKKLASGARAVLEHLISSGLEFEAVTTWSETKYSWLEELNRITYNPDRSGALAFVALCRMVDALTLDARRALLCVYLEEWWHRQGKTDESWVKKRALVDAARWEPPPTATDLVNLFSGMGPDLGLDGTRASGPTITPADLRDFLPFIFASPRLTAHQMTLAGITLFAVSDYSHLFGGTHTPESQQALLALALLGESGKPERLPTQLKDALKKTSQKPKRDRLDPLFKEARNFLSHHGNALVPSERRTALVVQEFVGENCRKGSFFWLARETHLRVFVTQWERDYAQWLSKLSARHLEDEWERIGRLSGQPEEPLYLHTLSLFERDTSENPSLFEAAVILAKRTIRLEWAARHWAATDVHSAVLGIARKINPSAEYDDPRLQILAPTTGVEAATWLELPAQARAILIPLPNLFPKGHPLHAWSFTLETATISLLMMSTILLSHPWSPFPENIIGQVLGHLLGAWVGLATTGLLMPALVMGWNSQYPWRDARDFIIFYIGAALSFLPLLGLVILGDFYPSFAGPWHFFIFAICGTLLAFRLRTAAQDSGKNVGAVSAFGQHWPFLLSMVGLFTALIRPPHALYHYFMTFIHLGPAAVSAFRKLWNFLPSIVGLFTTLIHPQHALYHHFMTFIHLGPARQHKVWVDKGPLIILALSSASSLILARRSRFQDWRAQIRYCVLGVSSVLGLIGVLKLICSLESPIGLTPHESLVVGLGTVVGLGILPFLLSPRDKSSTVASLTRKTIALAILALLSQWWFGTLDAIAAKVVPGVSIPSRPTEALALSA